jgi:hypothetical protein
MPRGTLIGDDVDAYLAATAGRSPLLQQCLQHPMLQQFLRYWHQACAGHAMPRRSDIDPAAIKTLLPHVLIVDKVAERRFRYRLVGTEIVTASGRELTGSFVGDNTTGHYREFLVTLFDTAFNTSRIVFSCNAFVGADAPRRAAIRLLVPLSDNGSTADRIIAIYIFDYDKRWHGAVTSDGVRATQDAEGLIEVL